MVRNNEESSVPNKNSFWWWYNCYQVSIMYLFSPIGQIRTVSGGGTIVIKFHDVPFLVQWILAPLLTKLTVVIKNKLDYSLDAFVFHFF